MKRKMLYECIKIQMEFKCRILLKTVNKESARRYIREIKKKHTKQRIKENNNNDKKQD